MIRLSERHSWFGGWVVLAVVVLGGGCSVDQSGSPYSSSMTVSPLIPTTSPARRASRATAVAAPAGPESRLSGDSIASHVLAPAYSPVR